eukprot:g17074.t1
MPLAKVFYSSASKLPAGSMQKFAGLMRTHFRVSDNVLQVVAVPSTFSYPAPVLVDIRAKALPERSAVGYFTPFKTEVQTLFGEGTKVRIEFYDPNLLCNL